MDLFESASRKGEKGAPGTPLAERLRPTTLDEILGQERFLSPKAPLRKEIESGKIASLIIWGPPGSGKTTFARAIASYIQAEFIVCNAIETGAKALRELGDEARRRRQAYQKLTVVFIDEIHRLNKSQQDVLLPFVEKGEFILIGATTENPSFELNAALLSRCRLIVFERLSENNLRRLVTKAFEFYRIDESKKLSKDALDVLVGLSDGDARRLINDIETIAFHILNEKTADVLEPKDIRDILNQTPLSYDKKGEAHYDTISAFIKSIRGSSPDAALYYLARMLEAGEDPVFIARRLVILASEDVGNADPRGLLIAISAAQAVQLVGLPECAINLAQAVTYLASAPKSNRSYQGWLEAQSVVRQTGSLPVPLHLRNAPTEVMKKLGYGKDYKYSHEGERGWLPQEYLPEKVRKKVFYEPSQRGFEKNITEYMKWLKGVSDSKSEEAASPEDPKAEKRKKHD